MNRAALTPMAVIADAAALADEEGFDAVSLSAVARRLGVQAPSLYSHVRDREALRDGISELALGELGARIATAIAGRAGRQALEGYASAHREYAQESPGRWQAMQRRVGASVVGSDAARQVVTLATAVLRGYPVPADQQVHAVRVLGSTINGFLTLESIGGFDHSEPAPEVSWRTTIAALDALLNSWPTSSQPEGTF